MLNNVTLAVPIFHNYGHRMKCQVYVLIIDVKIVMTAMACHRRAIMFCDWTLFFILQPKSVNFPSLMRPSEVQDYHRDETWGKGPREWNLNRSILYSIVSRVAPQLCPNFPPKLRRGSSTRRRVGQTRQCTEQTTRSKFTADYFLEIFGQWVLGICSQFPRSAHCYCRLKYLLNGWTHKLHICWF